MEWIENNLTKLREMNPLVHNITNFVVMNTTANALLALGASPIMAHAPEELEDIIRISDSVVINIGTLDEKWVDTMKMAIKLANGMGKPVVLDPVGSGATRYRTVTARNLLNSGYISVLRGNFSEIQSFLGIGETRGVDSINYKESLASEIAQKVAEKFNTVVALTGIVDYVTDSKRMYRIENGTPLLTKVTGTGCIATAIVGAFLAVTNPIEAAVSGLTTLEIAAEKAEEESNYPGTFHMKLYDWLYKINGELISSKRKVKEIVIKR